MGLTMRMGEYWSRPWLLVVIVFAISTICGAEHGGLDPTSKVPCSIRDPLMDPVSEVSHGQDWVWQVPSNPKGVLFVAHSLNEDPFTYFDPGPQCENCLGLPEERTFILEALRRGFAVIAVKSIGIGFEKWPPEDNEDLVIVLSVVHKFRKEHSLESLPFVAFGHSGGGYFVTILSLKLPISALLLSSCEGQPEVVENASPGQFPPIFFVYMSKELFVPPPFHIATRSDVEKSMACLLERGVPVAGKECDGKALYPHFFAERINCMTNEMSEKVYEAYKAEGWLDTDNFVSKNPFTEDWESVLWKFNALPFCEQTHDICLAFHVLRELKVSFGFHSFTRDGNEEMFSWLDSTLTLSHPVLSASH